MYAIRSYYVLTNRSIGKARTLVLENGGDYFHFSLLETEMPQFQTIISAIQVEQPLFTSNYLNQVRPNLVFDLGVPCNFSKEGLDQACYYDMDTIAAYTKQRNNFV